MDLNGVRGMIQEQVEEEEEVEAISRDVDAVKETSVSVLFLIDSEYLTHLMFGYSCLNREWREARVNLVRFSQIGQLQFSQIAFSSLTLHFRKSATT